MEAQLLPVLANLGVAGFAIYIMWRKDQAAATERDSFLEEIKEREMAFRQLEEQIRDKVFSQLAKNTEVLEAAMSRFKRPAR